jgi:hypothetical protein
MLPVLLFSIFPLAPMSRAFEQPATFVAWDLAA